MFPVAILTLRRLQWRYIPYIFPLPQAKLYKDDFENERRHKEIAHSLKEDMRVACDQKVQALDFYEKTFKTLTQQSEGASNENKDLEINSQVLLRSTSRRKHYQNKEDQQVEKV